MTWRRQLPVWSPVTAGALLTAATAPRRPGRHATSLGALIRAEYGASLVQLTQSGTAALALAMLAAAPEGTRPRVAMPAWGCYDLMTAADIVEAEVILYDLDADSLAPASSSFAGALAQRPTSVVVAHWFGLPVSLAPLLAAVRDAGATLIEDAAQGVGGTVAKQPLGSLGDFGVLSFARGKGRTGGRGGALLANNVIAAARLQRVAHRVAPARPGKSGLLTLAAQWAVGRPWAYGVPSSIPFLRLSETIYHPPSPIRGMPEWAAAVVNTVWQLSARESIERRSRAVHWASILEGNGSVRAFTESTGTAAGWLRFPVLVNDSTALLDAAARRLGVMPGYPSLLADLPLDPGRLANGGPWPGAARLTSRLRTLPTHSLLRSSDSAAIEQLLEREDRRAS